MKKILPSMKSVMLLMEKGHPSAPIEEEETKAACIAFKISYHGKMCSSVDEILTAVKENKDSEREHIQEARPSDTAQCSGCSRKIIVKIFTLSPLPGERVFLYHIEYTSSMFI